MRPVYIWPVVGVAAFTLFIGITLPVNRQEPAVTVPSVAPAPTQEVSPPVVQVSTPTFSDIPTPAQIRAIPRQPLHVVHEEELWRPSPPPPPLAVSASTREPLTTLYFEALLADPQLGCVAPGGEVNWAVCGPPKR